MIDWTNVPPAPPPESAELVSPSLRQEGGLPAYEIKFLVSPAQAVEVEEWADQRLARDAHASPDNGGAYRTTTLYLDTPALDTYHRMRGYRRNKFRLRRYGTEPWVYLERKFKKGDRVHKERTAVSGNELPLLADPVGRQNWAGDWFREQVHRRQLGPASLCTYDRTPFLARTSEGPVRLTLDRHLRGVGAGEPKWTLPTLEGGNHLLLGKVIVEMKFCATLPTLFKSLIADLRLNPGAVSKYRLCMDEWGTQGAQRGAS